MPDCRKRLLRVGGMTLLELLISLGLLAILIAIAFPVFQFIQATQTTPRCLVNLRTIYVATLAFAEDYQGTLPPGLGEAPEVNSQFTKNQYWWQQAYLGRYAVGPRNRPVTSKGDFSQQEVEVYNCPARFADAPDSFYSKNSPAVSYVMAARPHPLYWKMRTIPNPSAAIYLTEGRSNTVWDKVCQTGAFGVYDPSARLRRFHRGGLHILFLDGHVISFSGTDEEINAMLPPKAPPQGTTTP